MIKDAEEKGIINKDTVIIEPQAEIQVLPWLLWQLQEDTGLYLQCQRP